MRKKSLRAMESAVFQTPESRAEAIMQNILGANNVLVPPEAPFEEILQAILYNTPYTKEAEARIEEILLAIKNNGTYYGEPQSRDEEILLSKLNQTPYTKDAESRIEELFILWAAQSIVKQLEGVPPLTFTAQGQPLINWTIYGASGGVGDKTANLCGEYLDKSTINSSGVVEANNSYNLAIAEVKANTIYSALPNWSSGNCVYGFFTQKPARGSTTYNGERLVQNPNQPFSFTSPINGWVVIWSRIDTNPKQFMLVEGATIPTAYVPYGYKIPILCGGETNTIYLDTPLYDGDSISMADTGIDIPTINGQNTLAVDTTVQPEKVYIEYK